jgi:hypothetical protein
MAATRTPSHRKIRKTSQDVSLELGRPRGRGRGPYTEHPVVDTLNSIVSLFFNFFSFLLQIHFETKYQFKSSRKWPNSALLQAVGVAAAVQFPGFNFLPYRPLVSNIFSIYGRGFL